MALGEKVFLSVQAQGLANARKRAAEKPVVLSDSQVLKIHILVSGRLYLPCTRDNNPNSSERREYP